MLVKFPISRIVFVGDLVPQEYKTSYCISVVDFSTAIQRRMLLPSQIHIIIEASRHTQGYILNESRITAGTNIKQFPVGWIVSHCIPVEFHRIDRRSASFILYNLFITDILWSSCCSYLSTDSCGWKYFGWRERKHG
jgi:hypothetical protein